MEEMVKQVVQLMDVVEVEEHHKLVEMDHHHQEVELEEMDHLMIFMVHQGYILLEEELMDMEHHRLVDHLVKVDQQFH
jgi:hypothetical protein